MKRAWRRAALTVAALLTCGPASASNPIVPGWYADPEIRVFAGRYWIYPTYSDRTDEPEVPSRLSRSQREGRKTRMVWPSYAHQTFLDAFSSPDLVDWTRHRRVLDVERVAWAAYAVWAPSVIEANGRYHMFFSANDIQKNGEPGGIGLAVSDRPEGPFRDALGKPLIDRFHNGAQPIDPFAFRDRDGQAYLYYGGWGHCNVVRLSADLTSVVPHPDGSTFKEITPPGYTEGSFVVERRGTYYLMWSEGDWTTSDYRVSYAMGSSPTGPFKRVGTLLAQDARVARGAGHHSVVNVPGTDEWYIAYHRRPLDTKRGERRQLAIERMHFDPDGTIRPVAVTNGGVEPRLLGTSSVIPAQGRGNEDGGRM